MLNVALPPRETLTIEFKSDRKKLPDSDLLAAVICFANTEGGELWLGVEDDGTPTWLAPRPPDGKCVSWSDRCPYLPFAGC